jgi:transposase
MGQRKLSQSEREQIYLRKQEGYSLSEIAKQMGLSYACVRKWWRRGNKEGLIGLLERKRGRAKRGSLSRFAPEIQRISLELKQRHKRWGANRVLVEMKGHPDLTGLKLPSRSCLYMYFHQDCPECLSVWTKHKELPEPPKANSIHEIWQVDHQEGHRLADGSIATVCNIRDPYGAVMIASQAFEVKTEQRWRKITWEEVRQVLRAGFSEWHTLPDIVQTDNEMGLGGIPNYPFPSWLSLYLAGLGIKHTFIRSHRPTDQPQIERNHRTLDGFTQDEQSRQNMVNFQCALDRERFVYNHHFPARASNCTGQPPLQAHPALLKPLRPFEPEWERVLFNLQRVYDFLATYTFDRKVNRNGQVTLKGIHYTVGLAHKEKQIKVRLDARTKEWIFLESNPDGSEQELRRQPLLGINLTALTGYESQISPVPLLPIQLTLPLFV